MRRTTYPSLSNDNTYSIKDWLSNVGWNKYTETFDSVRKGTAKKEIYTMIFRVYRYGTWLDIYGTSSNKMITFVISDYYLSSIEGNTMMLKQYHVLTPARDIVAMHRSYYNKNKKLFKNGKGIFLTVIFYLKFYSYSLFSFTIPLL